MFKNKLYVATLCLLFVFSLGLFGATNDNPHYGQISGSVIDKETQLPLPGANVQIIDSHLGAASDLEGNFLIKKVPVGSYSLRITFMGYKPHVKTDVIVRSQRITFLEVDLRMSLINMESVVVTGGYFEEVADEPSAISFSHEEIRRAPGSAGDVSRIMMSLPSIAKVNDQQNSLIVRGGSPTENAFYVDNIEIPNINHFPTQGSTGGPIGMVNVDFIKNVDFKAGGFSASHGDRLSSVMDLSFREGNTQEFDGQLDLNFAGFGGTFEGPLPGEKGSYLFSLRRSYLDLIIDAIDAGTSIAPRYGDIQGKVAYDLNAKHKLSLLGIWGDDHSMSDREAAIENKMMVYGDQDWTEYTTGLNWRALWNEKMYSNTSLSYTSQKYSIDYTETATDVFLLKNRSLEEAYKFRNVNHLRLNPKHQFEFGLDAKMFETDYNNFTETYMDALGNETPQAIVHDAYSATQAGGFISYFWNPSNHWKMTLGLRGDYFSVTEKTEISPRLSLRYNLNEKTSFHAATGIYYQNLPLILLYQEDANKALKTPRADHYILGMEQMLSEDTKLSIEAYYKKYQNFPVDPTSPDLFLIDELNYRYGFFFHHENVNDEAEAYAQGIEVMVQKKLAEKIYGLASLSLSKTQYMGESEWKDRIYDNQFIFSMEGGYKPNYKWEFSLRWIYAGGAPYTPFNQELSKAANRGVFDENQINNARYPAYHSLNLRFDRRFHYKGSNLVFYLSVWNAYGRKNVAQYFWNEIDNEEDVVYQWSMLPIFGLEFEF